MSCKNPIIKSTREHYYRGFEDDCIITTLPYKRALATPYHWDKMESMFLTELKAYFVENNQ